MNSDRLFKNVSFFWKISGAFLVCLLAAFFIIRYFLCSAFIDVEKDMKQNVLIETQRGTDMSLSIVRSVLKKRMDEVSSACIESACEIDLLLQAGSLPPKNKLVDYVVDRHKACSFFLLLDSTGTLIRGAGDLSLSLADWELFSLADDNGECSAITLLPAPIAKSLKLLPPSAGNTDFMETDKILTIVSVKKMGRKSRPYFLVGAYLLNLEENLLPQAVNVSSRYGRLNSSSQLLLKPVFSIFQDTKRIATTVVGKDGKNVIGTEINLPDTFSGNGIDQIWRQKTIIKGKTFVSAYTPLLSVSGRTIGYIGSGVDVQDFLQVRLGSFEMFKNEIRKDLAFSLFISLFMALLVGIGMAKMLSNPLVELAGFTEEVAKGNLSIVVPYDGKDEIGIFASGFREMVVNLSKLVKSIKKATVELDGASHKMNENVTTQIATTSQQSAAVHETTATLEELAASSKQIAESSLAVVRLAAKTLESAKDGVSASKDTIKLMGTIRQAGIDDIIKIATLSSRVARIDEVMRLINAIADQTKLIAFNAAIEAAAAGEAGHRFNVVSEEIRRLADNVQAKGREIRSSVSDVQESAKALDESCREDSSVIESGVEVTGKTSMELEEILKDSESVLSDSKKISMATQEQRLATEQTLTAIKEINEGVTELANGMKSSKTVASQLSLLSTELSETVSCFELNEAVVTATLNKSNVEMQSSSGRGK